MSGPNDGQVNKLRVDGHDAVPPRQVLRMYSQMSLASRVDAQVFARVARMFQLGKIKVPCWSAATSCLLPWPLRSDASVCTHRDSRPQVGHPSPGYRPESGVPPEGEVEQVWKMLMLQWRVLEAKTAHVIAAMSGTVKGSKVEEEAELLRELIRARDEPEKAIHAYRMLVTDLPEILKDELMGGDSPSQAPK